jgi:protein-disulfide isomerase
MKIDRIPLLLAASLVCLNGLPVHAAEVARATTPVAKVGSTVLTEEDMKKDLGMSLYEAENSLFQVKKNWVDQKVKSVLFDQAAKEAGLSRQAWQAKEIDAKLTPPTQQEIDQWAPRFGVQGSTTPPSDANYAKTKEQARLYLVGQKRGMLENSLFQQLVQKNPVELLFAKPETPHIEVTYSSEDPMIGPKTAPITIIEFTDFQCPYCKRSQDTLKQVETTYGDKVKVIERQYPLPFHNRAKPAAEAALCAKEQGKFWEMHDKLFPSQSLEDADIQRFAKEVGLKEKKFNQCLADHKYAARIETDIADGQRFGVRGTPHFFINGRPISGAQPFEAFKTAIDEELAKTKS